MRNLRMTTRCMLPLGMLAALLSGCAAATAEPSIVEVTSLDDYQAKAAYFGRATAACMQDAGFDTTYDSETGHIRGSGTADTADAQNEALANCRTELELELGLLPDEDELPDSVRAEKYELLKTRYECLLQNGVPLDERIPTQQEYFSDFLVMSPEAQLGTETMQAYVDELLDTCPKDPRVI